MDKKNKKFIKRFRAIEREIANSTIYNEAKESFQDDIMKWDITDAEKSVAYAEFNAKSLVGLISAATEAALRSGVSFEEEKTLELKREAEVSLAQETVLKTNIEQRLLVAQSNLTLQQSASEGLKSTQLKADLNIKEIQAHIAYINYLSEKDKRDILVKSANDNANIKQGDLMINLSKVMADDSDGKIGQAWLTQVMAKVNEISTTENKLEKSTSGTYTFTPPSPITIDQNELNALKELPPAFVMMFSTRDARVNQSIKAMCMFRADEEATFSWDMDDGTILEGQKISHIYEKIGEKNIKCTISYKGETYVRNEIINVGR